MEEVVTDENRGRALEAVQRNRGAAGIDGMKTTELENHLQTHWERIRTKLLAGTYVPSPVRRVEIPKPNGGTRMLGIPTVQDRLIQQMLLQVLTPIFDPTFSEHSYGFRPGRSAQDAVRAAQQYAQGGKDWVVDFDITKFLDTASYCPRVAEKTRLLVHDFDSQAFTSSLPNYHGFEFAALYTLQHRLPRNAEFHRRFEHRQILRRRLLDDARAQFVGDPNLPGRARSYLLAGDASVGQPAMNRGRVHSEDLSCLANGYQFSVWRCCRRLEPWDTPIAS